ncbi:hypothetical protein GQ600_2576 [Phytophthora cactorum]|nr:hypothetical protein GQ600_18742 [Phytophthora cactorum]KAF1789783.1 hypothetical protein GQ600_2576 [Phytophthora cactorum]
MVLFLRQNGE